MFGACCRSDPSTGRGMVPGSDNYSFYLHVQTDGFATVQFQALHIIWHGSHFSISIQ